VDVTVENIIEEMLEPLDPKFLGPVKSIYCYLPSAGGCPSREFLETQDMKVQATYAKQFEKVCQGLQLRGDRWHPWNEEDGKGCKGLAEYKDISSKSRVMHVVEGNLHVLLFGFAGKKENKVDRIYVKRAIDLKAEYLSRRDNIRPRSAGRRA
jgi:hypothetical protein